jgi:hypothetical protein
MNTPCESWESHRARRPLLVALVLLGTLLMLDCTDCRDDCCELRDDCCECLEAAFVENGFSLSVPPVLTRCGAPAPWGTPSGRALSAPPPNPRPPLAPLSGRGDCTGLVSNSKLRAAERANGPPYPYLSTDASRGLASAPLRCRTSSQSIVCTMNDSLFPSASPASPCCACSCVPCVPCCLSLRCLSCCPSCCPPCCLSLNCWRCRAPASDQSGVSGA